MRYLLLSDIHANALALEAVLSHAQPKAWQEVIFLGDAVGYNAQPQETLEQLMPLPFAAKLMGNHDAMLLGLHIDSGTRRDASTIIEMQKKVLSPAATAFLSGLETHALSAEWEAVHSSLDGSWSYIDSLDKAHKEAPRLQRRLLFFGHTHVPILYMFLDGNGRTMARSMPLKRTESLVRLPPNCRVLINPGAVGQPRDGIAAASYAIFDSAKGVLEHYRVPYDVARAQAIIRQNHYPEVMAKRLPDGR